MATPPGNAGAETDGSSRLAHGSPPPAVTASATTDAPAAPRNPTRDPESLAPVDALVECRICLESHQPEDMVTPCACTGTVKYAHLGCLKRWCAERQSLSCELCAQPYNASVHAKLEPVVQEAQRTAADAALAAALSRAQGEPSAEGGLQMTWTRFWCQALVLLCLLVGVLYLALFVDVQHGGSPWTVLLWKVFTILLPLYLVGFWLRKTMIDSGFCIVMSARMRSMRQRRRPAPAARPAPPVPPV